MSTPFRFIVYICSFCLWQELFTWLLRSQVLFGTFYYVLMFPMQVSYNFSLHIQKPQRLTFRTGIKFDSQIWSSSAQDFSLFSQESSWAHRTWFLSKQTENLRVKLDSCVPTTLTRSSKSNLSKRLVKLLRFDCVLLGYFLTIGLVIWLNVGQILVDQHLTNFRMLD